MPTGDGLLVRLLPTGTIPLAAFTALCAAARVHGNGVIEVTSRGSIQVRGLSATSAPRFAAAIAALGIAADDGVAVHCNALTGLDAEEVFDAGGFAAALRYALAQESMAAKLSAKVAVAVDGGGALGLTTLAADIRLCAQAINRDIMLHVGVGGDAMHAADLGMVAPEHGVEVVIRLLDVLAKRGRNTRARDIIATDGAAEFRSAIADFLVFARPREGGDPAQDSRWRGNERTVSSPIGLHRLRDGSLACGVGLTFGHADAASLDRLTVAAAAAGASSLRAAPGRVLLAIGLTRDSAHAFIARATTLGFIVRADDPRRRVIACAGAPICTSAHIASRTLAPLIAEQAARHLDDDFTIHISGCAKSCAHAAPAPLTVVGTPNGCALIANGSTQDVAYAVVPAHELPAAIMTYAQEQKHEAAHV
jgi:precorrin-3B synthase